MCAQALNRRTGVLKKCHGDAAGTHLNGTRELPGQADAGTET